MAEFPTSGVLSVTTGILMGDIGDVYGIVSFPIGRPAFTHELGHYAERAKRAILSVHPGLPTAATSQDWQDVKDLAEAHFGKTFELDESLRDCLIDGKGPLSTLVEMMDRPQEAPDAE